MVTLHRSPVSDQAVVGAVLGALELGAASGYAHPEQLKRMSAIAEACEGAPWEEIADRYGEEHATAAGALVEGFFGRALKKLGKVAKGAVKLATKNPLGKLAMSAVPGASLATQAFNMASPLLKGTVQRQQHLPPAQRAPLALSPRSAPSAARAPGAPLIVRPVDPNVELLTTFGAQLQRAYEFGRGPSRSSSSRSPARPAPARTRPRSTTAKRKPGTAWPR
jgi:hypothetical protein